MEYYNVKLEKKIEFKIQNNDPSLIYESFFMLDMEEVVQERTVYNFLDLLGDMGGLVDIIVSFFGIVLFPMSKFSFILKALEKLYQVSSKDSSFLQKKTLKKSDNKNRFKTKKTVLPENLKNTEIDISTKNNHPIKLSFSKKF
jgi:hypothetical protein